MKSCPALAVAAALLAPLPVFANAVVHVKCAADCKVEIANRRGEKVSDREWRFEKLPAGVFEVEVRGKGRPQGGYADIPADGEVVIEVSDDSMLVNGQFGLDRKAATALIKARKEAAEGDKKAERERRDQEKREKREQEQADWEKKDQDKPSASAKPGAKTKVLVVGLTAKAIDQDTADLFCDALVGELRKRSGLQVADRADIAAVIGAEREKQLLGCTDGQCMAELGGALGAEFIIRGDVGRVGKVLKVHLVLSDAQKGASAATVSEIIKSEANEAFFDKVPKFVDQLLAARK
ncbi:MAG: hypothetical protein QM765_42725 [Myxococcales bacterium]